MLSIRTLAVAVACCLLLLVGVVYYGRNSLKRTTEEQRTLEKQLKTLDGVGAAIWPWPARFS